MPIYRRMLSAGVVLTLTVTSACSRQSAEPAAAATAAAPKPLRAGVDAAGFDKAVRPQDDLYTFVNGAWLAKTAIPPDRGAYGGFYEAIDRTQERLREIVESAAKATNKGAGSDEQKLGDFHTAFMDESRANQLGRKPLDPELARIDALATKADLARHMARMLMLNVTTLVGGYVDGDAQAPDTSVLYMSQSGLGLPDRDYYLKDDPKLKEYRQKYLAYVARMLTLGGQTNPDAAAKDIVALETRLARSHWTNVESRDAVKTYNKVALADLGQQFPGLDWNTLAQELGVSSAKAVIVAQPSYFKAMAALVNEMPVDRWKPYLKFHTATALAPYLSADFVEARFDFYGRTLQGVKEMQPRWKRAVNNLDSALGELLGKVYVDRYFKPEAKARMERLVENLRGAFREGIDKLEWMGPETKKEAQAKLAAFRPKIGYPSKWRDYSKVEIRPDDLVGNMMRAWMAESVYQLGKAGKPIDPEEWGMTPQTVNAYYNPVRNEIVFPAAILQPPFFDMEADDAVNYGGIGGVIGHEMGHGFDDQGRRYDAKGQLRDWWTQKDGEEFTRRAKGLVAQYSAMEALPGLKVNGELTLGENIGDLTGVTIAHRAYELSLGGKEAPVIDGMTGNQRFFYGWVQAWRAKYRDDALRQQVMANPHAPDMMRGNGPLPNVLSFYTTFGVKDGDKMWLAPDKRVKIW
ncbi:MAG TPA: M13-type metalloendopeptidase [Vicinamibacterales bacterium]|nr:M13-type metalloendopeptidase [Vicinamibacterales bacterium]